MDFFHIFEVCGQTLASLFDLELDKGPLSGVSEEEMVNAYQVWVNPSGSLSVTTPQLLRVNNNVLTGTDQGMLVRCAQSNAAVCGCDCENVHIAQNERCAERDAR